MALVTPALAVQASALQLELARTGLLGMQTKKHCSGLAPWECWIRLGVAAKKTPGATNHVLRK
eukprot:8024397-Lingulodinium_polyedra.AAC.1